MSDLIQLVAAKLPIIAGAGILGVSVAGLGAGLLGLAFPLEVEITSAAVGMIIGAWTVLKSKA